MLHDEELLSHWDETITYLSQGKHQEWQAKMGLMISRLDYDLAPCVEDAKLRAVGQQMDTWWGFFWSHGDESFALFDQNMKENKFQITKHSMAMRLNWETGYYSDAGARFANIFKILIGEAKWVDFEDTPNQENYENYEDERYPLADFYAGYFEFTHGAVFYDQI